MASLKSKLFKAMGRSSEDPVASQEAGKYKLLVTAGPAYDKSKHQTVHVNSDQAVYVENEFLRAKIKVRIREYRGLPTLSPLSSPYFDDPVHEKDQYSIAFSFVPKRGLPSVDTVWGNDFDHPIRERLPPGVNAAFKIVKGFIDTGLQIDAYADEPWLYGPSITSWFALRIGEKLADDEDFPAPVEDSAMKEGAEGSGQEIRERLHIPSTYSTRHKHFLSAANREAFVFEEGRLYQGDFFKPYIDFGNFALKLPGFSLKVIKYVDQKSHCLRYVFKHRKTGDVYFNINFNLLWGENLEEAMKEDEEQKRAGAQQMNGHAAVGCKSDTGKAKQGPDGQAQAGAQTASTEAASGSGVAQQPQRPSQSGAQRSIRLHAGDHGALADHTSVNNITNMLRNTSTSDKSSAKADVFDDVD